jgi:small conductance mechanosensitive channel
VFSVLRRPGEQRFPPGAALLAAWLVLIVAPCLSWGAEAATRAPVLVGQRRIFDVGARPGQPAEDRAAAINRRIESYVRNPDQIAPVAISLRGSERVLAVAGREVATVTAQDAADNLTTVPLLAEDWRQELDDALSAVRAQHETLWAQIGGAIVASGENLLRETAALIPRLVSTLLVIVLTFFGARGARSASRRIVQRAAADVNTQQLVQAVTYYTVWTLGWVVGLGTLGVDPAALVAGLGVTTLALGFALKDLLSNLVSGFLILTTRPFRIGDYIGVGDYDGIVEQIELRATHLRTFDNRLVIIPNADLYTATVINNTAAPCRRQEFVVGVSYDADLEHAQEVSLQVAQETAGVLPEPAPDVLVHAFGDSSIDLKIRFYTDSRSVLGVGSAVRQALKARFDVEGITIPFPVRTLYMGSRVSEATSRDGDAPPWQASAGRSEEKLMEH